MRTDKKLKSHPGHSTIIMASLFFGLFVASLFFVRHISQHQTDLVFHTNFINSMLSGTKVVPHFLWHLLVYTLSSLTGMSLIRGAIIITALSIAVLALIKYDYFVSQLKEAQFSRATLLVLTFISMIAMPVYLPWWSATLYLGQGGSGIWHSPTFLLLKPIAFLALFSTLRFLDQRKTSEMTLAILLLMLSIVAKPNFILMFIPSLIAFLFLFRHTMRLDRQVICFVLGIIVSSLCILTAQFYFTYNYKASIIQDVTTIIISPGSVWRIYSTSILLSILITLAFPVYVLTACKKKDKILVFSWLLIFFSLVQAYLFAEATSTHQIKRDGNFFWGYYCAIDFVFTFSLIQYVKMYKEYRFTGLGNVLLLLQVSSGLIYLKHILLDNNFW